ncbi:MAG: TonB-dependent receptor plug domain-containing protein [Bacteroidia bacterium]|nr:TonB-dependent receptor plug domain-containing protein [Bacteroidia bacterium]
MSPRTALLTILLLVFSVTVFAQTAVLKGRITNPEGLPFHDLIITAKGFPKVKTRTNVNGEFYLTLPADTTLRLIFSHVTITPEERVIRLKPGSVETVNLVLVDVIMSDEVVIEDQNNRKKFVKQIPVNVLPVQVGPSGDINAVLRAELGVSMTNELSSGYSVRGGNYDENLVYVNDIEVYRPFLVRSGQQEGLSFANPDLVSNILFSAGGFEAKYGDKMSSVMDITYKKPTSFAGSFSGSALGGSLHLEGSSESRLFSWLLGARQKSSQYILGALDTEGEFKPSFYDVQTYLTRAVTDEFEIHFLGNISSNRYHVIPESRQSDFGTVNQAFRLTVFWDGQEVDAFRSFMGAVSFIHKPHNRNLKMRYIFSGFHTSEMETFDLLGQYRIDALENDFGKDDFGDVAYNLGIGGLLHHARNYLNASVYSGEHRGTKIFEFDPFKGTESRWDWGVKYQQEFIHDQLSEWKMTDSAGYSIPQGDPGTVELQEVVKTSIDLESFRTNAYGQYTRSRRLADTSEISITAGVRASYWSVNGQFLLSPRLSVSWEPNWKQDYLFRAAAGYYHQPPFYRELRDMYGMINKDVKAQTSIHFLAGLDRNFKMWRRPFKWVTEIYFKKLENLVPYEVDNVRIRYYAKNMASGFATGIDMKVNGEFVKGIESWFTLSVMTIREDVKEDFFYKYYNSQGEQIIFGYTANDSITDSVRFEPGFIPRPTDQLVTFGLFFQDYLPRFPRCKMHLSLQFGSGLPFGPPSFERYKDTLRYPFYRRADIGFSYELVSDSSLFFKRQFFRHFSSMWLAVEVFNLFATNNTVSYLWIKDITDRQYAIPNYLTRRMVNVKLVARFGKKKGSSSS